MRPHVISLGVLTLIAMLAAPAGSREIVSECGEIYRSQQCVLFHPYWPDGASLVNYVLPDTVQLPDYTECVITGEVEECHQFCDGLPYPLCLMNIQITECTPEHLGCGVLDLFEEEYHCYTWAPLDDPGNRILVDNLHGFASGDTVIAEGIRAAIPDICVCGCGVLLHTSLSPCPDTLTSTSRLSWGRMRALFHE